MNVLLLSMPDSFEHMPAVAIRMPNGALASLAGNVDPHHRVSIADLILVQSRVREAVERLVRDLKPDVVGLSVMTFQRTTALRIARLIRALRPETQIVAGGYDPSLAPTAYEECPDVGFIVRGEGEQTFRELLRAIEGERGVRDDCRSVVSDRDRLHPQRRSADRPARRGAAAAAQPQRPRAWRLHAARPAGRRRRDVAGLHVRLQLLLDHRDARPQLSHLSDRAGAGRHRATPDGTVPGRSFSSTTTSRSTSGGSNRCARRSSTAASTIPSTSSRR